MMTNDEWKKAYSEGFKDGYEEGKKSNWIGWGSPPPPGNITPTQLSAKKTCPVCGIELTSPMGYVCGNENCPTFPRVRSATSVTTGLHEYR